MIYISISLSPVISLLQDDQVLSCMQGLINNTEQHGDGPRGIRGESVTLTPHMHTIPFLVVADPC